MGYDPLALTALIVSLVALITTILQVLQQYLASATDGYRRCKHSVMGPWGLKTYRRFRWDELRFEVVFRAPVIFVALPDNTKGPIPERAIHTIDGSVESCNATHTPPLPPLPPPTGQNKGKESNEATHMPPPTEKNKETVHTTDDERASWVTLLTVIQREERDSREWEKAEKNKRPPRGQIPKEPIYTIAHQIQEKTRSWDFMPARTTKPYATTALTHLVEIVGLLGMYWKAFDVAKGDLTAEGNGCFFTSSLVSGLGLMTTFSITGRSKFEENRVIPSIDIKEWVFGFVPSILGQSLEVRSVEGIERTLAKLKCGPEILKLYPEKKNSSYIPSVTFELIAMLAKPVRIRGSNLKMLPNPTDEKWLGDSSLIDWSKGMRFFQRHITALIASPAGLHELISAISEQWKKMEIFWQDTCDIHMREVIHDGLEMTARYLELENEINVTKQEITDVVVSHLSSVIKNSEAIQSAVVTPGDTSTQDAVDAQGDTSTYNFVQFYFNTILTEVESGGNLAKGVKEKRNAIWVALMFRMICWFLLHDFDEMDVNIMPSKLMGSRMPVFIN